VSVTGSSLSQALLQRREQLVYALRLCTLVIFILANTAACGGRPSGGPDNDDTLQQPRPRHGIDR
jgi:hypothetical protein